MNWIKIEDIVENNPQETIALWEYNKYEPESSKFQKGVYYGGKYPFIRMYPQMTIVRSKNKWEHYDLNGDICTFTHFLIIEPPK